MASKSIVAKGATYNGVESVTFPVSGGGSATFYEISDTTAGASDVASGKYFFTSSGVKTQGTATGGTPNIQSLSVTQNGTYTASGGVDGYSPVTVSVSGGGGLVYETGTWTPSEDVARPTINFTNTHSSMPIYVCLSDSGNYYDTLNSNMNFMYCDYSSIANSPIYASTTNLRYALVFYIYRGTSATGASQSYNHITNPVDDQSEGSNGYAKYWVKPDSFRPYTNSDSRFWRAGRTYKWIAVWAPTT